MIENAILDIYLANFFLNNTLGFSIIAILLMVLCNICLVYFALAKAYFFFFDPPKKENDEGKDFYGLTEKRDQPIPYEIRNKNVVNNKTNNHNNSKKDDSATCGFVSGDK